MEQKLLATSKRLTKLVEGRWTVVRTRVRFPSTPLEESAVTFGLQRFFIFRIIVNFLYVMWYYIL